MSHEEQDDELIVYAHTSGIFSLSYPAGWTVTDTSASGIIQTAFRCAEPPVLVQFTIKPAPVDDSDAAMETLIRQFITAQAGGQPDFALDEPELQPDDSIWASYNYGSGAQATVGDALIWIDEPFVVSLAVEQAEHSVDDTQPIIDDMIDSLAIDPSVPMP